VCATLSEQNVVVDSIKAKTNQQKLGSQQKKESEQKKKKKHMCVRCSLLSALKS